MDYPLNLPGQLREHLRALRKTAGLTQEALGSLLGVKQARIAEIEANPSSMSVEQLMRLLSVLQTSLVLRTNAFDMPESRSKKKLPVVGTAPVAKNKQSKHVTVNTPASVNWAVSPVKINRTGSLVRNRDFTPPPIGKLVKGANPEPPLTAASQSSFAARGRKGSW